MKNMLVSLVIAEIPIVIAATMEQHTARGAKNSRHISEITAVASKFGNSAKTIVPRSWPVKIVIAFIHSEYVALIHDHRLLLKSKGKDMSNEVLLSNLVPFAGSGLVGYAIGFALKKILKLMLIIVGFMAGMFFVGVQLLQGLLTLT